MTFVGSTLDIVSGTSWCTEICITRIMELTKLEQKATAQAFPNGRKINGKAMVRMILRDMTTKFSILWVMLRWRISCLPVKSVGIVLKKSDRVHRGNPKI